MSICDPGECGMENNMRDLRAECDRLREALRQFDPCRLCSDRGNSHLCYPPACKEHQAYKAALGEEKA